MNAVRGVVLCGSVVAVVMFASLGWVWPLIVALAVLAVSLLAAEGARS